MMLQPLYHCVMRNFLHFSWVSDIPEVHVHFTIPLQLYLGIFVPNLLMLLSEQMLRGSFRFYFLPMLQGRDKAEM